ncbi:3-hydroxyacyl-ACP dehydratase FabZ [Cryobacterium sp. TMS1-13-1]|uniref:3-hydroxyacyl-ACP dehydratase FabZ n=1 Tax=Cryobacterium sp. TMS1-13-1 TaxID=1259220 RepID=UPI0010691016|nr:3-hydroxyacyl-ACP dehydratase FabZ [Cryobacterium sp. TMS1-13-1]
MSVSTSEIMQRLPHRYPFLMVDRVDALASGVSIAAVKNVTANEPYFTGHFPENPIMPGVMIVEALAQAGGLLFDIGERLCVLARIDNVKFRGIVRPGDQMILEAEALATMSAMGKVRSKASVEGRIVVTAEITYSFIERGIK